MFDYDPEVPAGYQDADLEQCELEAQSNAARLLRKRGVCSHGWQQGMPASGQWPERDRIAQDRSRGHFPDRPTNYDVPADGYALCLDCGQHVPSPTW